MTERLTNMELMERAARGLGKVDQLGRRGVSLVTMDEIEAMAGLLATFGLVPIYPGEPPPDPIFVSTRTQPIPQKEPDNV